MVGNEVTIHHYPKTSITDNQDLPETLKEANFYTYQQQMQHQ